MGSTELQCFNTQQDVSISLLLKLCFIILDLNDQVCGGVGPHINHSVTLRLRYATFPSHWPVPPLKCDLPCTGIVNIDVSDQMKSRWS